MDGVLVSYDVPTLDPMPSSGFLLVSPNGRYLAGTGSTSEVHPRRYVFYLDLQEGVVKAVFGSQARSVTLTKIRDDGTLTGWYEVDRFPFDSTTYYFTFRPPGRFEETTQPPDPPSIPTPAPSGYGEPRVFVYSHNERFAGGWVVEVTTGRTFGCVWDASGRATLLPRIEGVTAGEGVGWVSDDGTRALYDGHHDVRDEGLQALWVRGRTPILTETFPQMAGGPARPFFGRWFARAKAANGRYLSVDAGHDSGAQVYLVHVP
ncbi:MAG: hypothetical protein KIS66_00320 [Fimbriimonadaceae bacterium]|nr:hypothetical protein [Fimbriimonadaceae bacterium]